MVDSIFLGLIHNGALLLSVAFVFFISEIRWRENQVSFFGIQTGFFLGVIGIAVMLSSWVYEPGIIFDTRSVLLGISGLFFGLVPTLIAMLITVGFRIYQGGSAALMGVCVILASGTIGIIWRHLLKKSLAEISLIELYLLGIVVHIAMLLMTFTLPLETANRVLSVISLPVMVIYPVATAMLGLFMTKRLKQDRIITDLQESEERLRLAISASNIGFFDRNLQTGEIHFSSEWKKQIGYEENEIANDMHEWEKRVNPEDLEVIKPRLEEWEKGLRREYEAEYRLVHKDGSYRWILARGVNLLDADGKVKQLIGYHIDVTDRKLSEEAISRSEKRFRGLAESSQDTIMLIDRNLRHVYLNPAGELLYEMSKENVFGKTLHELGYDNELSSLIESDIQEVFAKKSAKQNLYAWERVEKKSFLDLRLSPILNSEGNVDLVLGITRDITSLKETELALIKSKELYQVLTESIHDVVWILDAESMRFIYISPSDERLRGFTAEEVLAKPITNSMKETDRDYFVELIQTRAEALRSGEVSSERIYVDEIEQPCKDGSTIWTELVSSLYTNPENSHIEIRGVTRDISERKHAEEILRQKEIHFQSLIENAPDGITLVSQEGQFLYASPSARRLFGYLPEDSLDASPAQETHPEDIPAVMEALSRVMQDPRTVANVQYRFRRKDGYWRWIESNFSNLLNEPSVQAIVINFRDITESKQAEDALRESESKFRQIFETTRIGISLHNAKGQFLSGNPAILNLLGYTQEEYTCLTIKDISYPEDIQRELLPFQELWEGKRESYTTEKRNLHKNGQIIWGQLTCTIVKDKEGNPQYSIGMFENIDGRKQAEEKILADQAELQRLLISTEQSRRALLSMVEDQKTAEEKIRQLNAELELRVRDRTAQLESANRELEAFSYSVSHDLRAPLRALDGFSSILLSDYAKVLDVQGQHYLERIQEASRRMGQLINDLLSLSRVTRTEFTRQQVNLSQVAEEVLNELKTQEPEREVNIKITKNLIVQGDIQLLKIALGNLMSNAYKFTNLQKKAKITFGKIEQSGEQVYFVRDNGAGFDMAYASKLFTPFQRLHGIKEFPGTGIGLVIVQRIINRHGGRIWPEAKLNEGATFYFTLGGG